MAMGDVIPQTLRGITGDQAGVVTRQQALGAGMSHGAIVARIKFGRWQRVHVGVYATFTGPMTRDAQRWAAVLAAGPGAQLSHETAAEINRLTERPSPFIHVTIPANRRVTSPQGVIIHLSSTLSLGWRFARGIPPHTFAEETVVDLVHAATDLNDVIEYRYDHDVEQAHGLPKAAKQVKYTKPDGSRGYRDRYYEQYKLIVELDGKQYHPPEHRGRDQDRDNDAAATVGSTLRYGWVDVTRKRCESATQVHTALTGRGYTGPLKPCSPVCAAITTAAGRRVSASTQ
jgi:hypothetical protein